MKNFETYRTLEQLIVVLCPNGVEFRDLGRACSFRRGTPITKESVVNGDVPVIAGGQKPAYFHNVANRQGEIIAVSSSGAYAGFVSYWQIPVFLSDSFSVDPDNTILIPKFVYYYLKNIQHQIYKCKKGGGIPHVHGSDLSTFRIPLPPLAIQEEIVKILDSFTELEAELDAELDARRKQYRYYLNNVFDTPNAERKALGEIGKFVRGKRFVRTDIVTEGAPCIHYGELYTHYNVWTNNTKSFIKQDLAAKLRVAHTGDVILVAAGETIEDIGNSVAWLGESDVVIHDACFAYSHNLNPKYVSYFFKTDHFRSQIRKYISSGKISAINATGLSKAIIPIPDTKEQDRIVSFLDKFDSLVSNISIGLPAELNARRQQYEYYRNKLLTFKEYAV